jgi:hypothetical protein
MSGSHLDPLLAVNRPARFSVVMLMLLSGMMPT